jgi:integrase
VRLSDQTIRSLPLPEKGQKTHWDSTLRGFGCRVSQGGTRSFVLQIGKERQLITIGRYHPDILPLAKARAEAKRILAENVLGKHRPRSIPFDEAKETFLAVCKTKNKARTVYDYSRLLKRYFTFGRKQLSEISTSDIARKLDRIKAPAERNYATTVVKIFFNWAYRRSHIDVSPAARFQANQAISRDRVLSAAELAHVLELALDGTSIFDSIVCLLILTGQRRSEIAALEWSWIDVQSMQITLPSAITKNRRNHCFPIGKMTLQIVQRQPRMKDNPYVFPAARDRYKKKPATTFNGWAKPKSRLDEALAKRRHVLKPWTLHDLRRTFRTNWAELGIIREVAEKYINHVSGVHSGVNAIYDRYSFMDEMRKAVALWETRLMTMLNNEGTM